jgi:hypothetical protein
MARERDLPASESEPGADRPGALDPTPVDEPYMPAPEQAPATAAGPTGTMIPGRQRRRTKVERGSMRLVATAGIIGIDVALGAILVSQDVAGWIVGLVIGLVSVILAAVLWSSRQL